jgi:hypothetical protein
MKRGIIIINNDTPFISRANTTKHHYQLASELSKGKHNVEIFKRTEWNRGKTSFYGFKLKRNTKILKKPSGKKRILPELYNCWRCC